MPINVPLNMLCCTPVPQMPANRTGHERWSRFHTHMTNWPVTQLVGFKEKKNWRDNQYCYIQYYFVARTNSSGIVCQMMYLHLRKIITGNINNACIHNKKLYVCGKAHRSIILGKVVEVVMMMMTLRETCFTRTTDNGATELKYYFIWSMKMWFQTQTLFSRKE